MTNRPGRRRILLLSIAILSQGCANRPDPEYVLHKVNFVVPKNYSITSFDADYAPGDARESYMLKVSRRDYDSIKSFIKQKSFFQDLGNAKKPITIDWDTVKTSVVEKASKYDGKYFYQIYKQGIIVTVAIEHDSVMSLDYDDL